MPRVKLLQKHKRREGRFFSQVQNILIKTICDYFQVEPEKLGNKSRKAHPVLARHVLCYLGRDLGFSYYQLGKMVGRDHSTAIHGRNRILHLLNGQDPVASHVKVLKMLIDDALKEKGLVNEPVL